jgi:hypothetical protein
MNALLARHALLPGGWASDVRIAWDGDGTLTEVRANAAATGEPTVEYVLPGMVNLHSHAFQRALGGLTERVGARPDSFWTWRDLMYRFAATITPEQAQAIAAQLFSECLRHGYTALCEFHYIQRDPAGAMYARPAEMAERVAAAAGESGIGLTLLPVLYSHAGFGAQPLQPEQQRFRTDVDTVLAIAAALEPLRGGQLEVGAAPHSLRAADVKQVRELLHGLPAGRPLHIHIAEQQGEVAQSLAFSGQRPVDYLLSHLDIDARWPPAGLSPACVRRRKPTSATACSRWAVTSRRAARSASAATATSPRARSKNCAGSSTASAWLVSAAMWRPRPQCRMWPHSCGRGRCAAAHRRQAGRWGHWPWASGPICWCWTTPTSTSTASRRTRSWAASSSAGTTIWCATCSQAGAGWSKMACILRKARSRIGINWRYTNCAR